MKFWNCILRVQEIKLLEILGHQISIFQQGIKFCGPHFSYLIFEAVRFWGFWGPAEMRENDFEENKVTLLIFKQL